MLPADPENSILKRLKPGATQDDNGGGENDEAAPPAEAGQTNG